ncbi:hypothetical protein DFJ74DRAFT_665758 [Hyaloraphidium curvatum]|nr:hypothetical protein DFJ74DRAFT_665758 [Hyaloraphidium curvatum]
MADEGPAVAEDSPRTGSGTTDTPAARRGSPPPGPRTNANRLFVGNLPQTLSEYALVKLFEPFGKITQLEYIFHRSGPLVGLPKGYAFVEFADSESAVHAIAKLNGKKLAVPPPKQGKGQTKPHHNRPLVVSFSIDPSATADSGDVSEINIPLSAGFNSRTSIGAAPYGPRSALGRGDGPRKEPRFSSYTSSGSGGGSYRGLNPRGYGGSGDRGRGRGALRGTGEREPPRVQLKTNAKLANASTESKIAALERQLKLLEEGS